jgi:twitching motility protein PilT
VTDFADLVRTVLDRGASDLHISAGVPPTIRVNGSLMRLDMPPLRPAETRELIFGILTQDQRQKLEENLELDFSWAVPGKARFLEELRLPLALREWTVKPRGLVLVTGPTGSGKSTTLASLINEINETRDCHIMTVEDPIEFVHRHKRSLINQREVGADTLSFANALKSVLRQDPDVILVGELRDLETMSVALTAAETGHLVFATLHTQDAPQTIDRVIDVFPSEQQAQVRMMLSTALQGVCTQQLLPTRQGGRAVVCEVLNPTPAVRNLIREGKTHQIYSMMQTGSAHGMQSMDAALVNLVRQGTIDMNMALEHAGHPDELKRLLGQLRAAS